jgi:predicted MFS family arabinose efflux permease
VEANRRWVAIGGASLAVGLVYLAIFAVPPLIAVLVDDLDLSHAQAGALMSVCLGGFLAGSLVSGRAVARFGTRGTMVAALVVCGAATACLPVGNTFGVFLVCRLAVGIAGGLIYAPGLTLVLSLLPARLGNVGVGVFLAGLSLGSTVAFFATPLLEGALGWRSPFFVFGAVVLVGAAVVWSLIGSAGAARASVFDAKGVLRELLGNRTLLVTCGAIFVSLFVAYGVFTWIPPYLDEDANLSRAQISVTAMLMTLVGIPATLAAGWLADRTRRPLLVAGVALLLPVTLVVLASTSQISHATATVVAALSAFGVSGGLIPLYALPPTLTRVDVAASASGVAAAFGMAGGIVSTYLGGYLIGATGGYGVAFAAYTITAAVTVFVLLPLLALNLRVVRQAASPG